jgi:hypothetical protein
MDTFSHILWGILLLALYPFIGNPVLIVFLSSILIDLDHLQILIKEDAYTWSKIKKTVRKAQKAYKRDPENAFDGQFFVFHSIECSLLLIYLAFFYPPLVYVVLGFAFHIITDMIHHRLSGLPSTQWFFLIVDLKSYRRHRRFH